MSGQFLALLGSCWVSSGTFCEVFFMERFDRFWKPAKKIWKPEKSKSAWHISFCHVLLMFCQGRQFEKKNAKTGGIAANKWIPTRRQIGLGNYISAKIALGSISGIAFSATGTFVIDFGAPEVTQKLLKMGSSEQRHCSPEVVESFQAPRHSCRHSFAVFQQILIGFCMNS